MARLDRTLKEFQTSIVACQKCPRLTAWRKKISEEKVRRFANCDYWGKPLPGFGDAHAEVFIAGLAPAAHGGNRTGRIFTGDKSGDWLFRALWKAGFASQAESISRRDGMKLTNCFITACCRCSPPQNKLLLEEIRNCRPFLLEEITLLKKVKVVVGLGKIGFDAIVASYRELGLLKAERNPKFGHSAVFHLNNRVTLIGSFHPSQQNTFTKRLTESMFDAVFEKAKSVLLEDK